MRCAYCKRRIYLVLNPRTHRAFYVDTLTGEVNCSANPVLPHMTLDELPDARA